MSLNLSLKRPFSIADEYRSSFFKQSQLISDWEVYDNYAGTVF